MNTLRSKGPWKVDPNNPRFILGTEDKAVAKVFWEHDRHLIAAAPDMAFAIRCVIGWSEAPDNKHPISKSILLLLKDVLAQAERN